MFNGAGAFNGNISAWNVDAVTSMYAVFYNAASFNRDLTAWDVGSIVNNNQMFPARTMAINR